MSKTTKLLSDRDHGQVLQAAAVIEDDTIMVNGFLVGKVGRKVVQTISTTSISGDTAVYTFSENGLSLYSLTLIFTDATQNTLISAERTA